MSANTVDTKPMSGHTPEFKREERYIVIKLSDARAALNEAEKLALSAIQREVAKHRDFAGKNPLKCVVIEDDWPEYEPAWTAIERRVRSTIFTAELEAHARAMKEDGK